MLFERYIARRFMPRKAEGGGFSGPLAAIAVAGIALGVLVMVMAVSILRGFQGEIAGKVAGFGSHITVTNFSTSADYQEHPLEVDSALAARLRAVPGVRHVQYYATKGGMVKTGEQIHGIVLRGVSAGSDTTFLASCLTAGRLPHLADSAASNEVAISATLASKLRLAVGDKMRTYFWQERAPRARAFTVSGIYSTDLTEMDDLIVVGDLRQVQRLSDWTPGQVGGYELLVADLAGLDATAAAVLAELPYDLTLRTVVQEHPALFSWLDLLNANITLILTIMCIVSAIAIVSALLIMIFEKGATIGILKTLGASNASVRRIFLLKAVRLILWGIGIGLALALALSWVQRRWQPVRLDPESYSMSHVPVEMDWRVYALVAVGTLAVCLAALLLPASYISRISPAETVKGMRSEE